MHKSRHSALFSLPEQAEECVNDLSPAFVLVFHLYHSSDEEGFSRPLVERLLQQLEDQPIPHLSPNEQQALEVLVRTTLEVGVSVRRLCIYLNLMKD